MERKEDIFEKAVESLKNDPVPPGPAQELVDATLAQLSERSGRSGTEEFGDGMSVGKRLKTIRSFGRVAAAAVVLIAAGYAIGRSFAPRPLDMEQIQAAIEPAIGQNLLDETRQYVQLSLANGYLQIKDELSQQYRQDLSRVAIQMLAASNTATNELLTELIDSIHMAQIQDRQRVAAALEQIALNQLRDRNQLSIAFAALAVQTEDELLRTKQDMAHALSCALPDNPAPHEFEDPDNPNERSKK
ncbi:MAG: hypothetical protein JSW66_11770 [Phycisphaerales bacterium]|nr:MAG: hypothetical protein JSW66_11770 [Phycisphaerales bacterium]